MRGAGLSVPDNLNVTGRGLSPRQCSPPSPEDVNMMSLANSSQTSFSDGEADSGEDFTVLDGVREMNHMLVRQIETLRLKIKIDERNYGEEKAKIVQTKETEIQQKQGEIEELRESVIARDDAILKLTRAANEKDRTIQEKCAHIEELHGVVKQTNDFTQKLQKQMAAARRHKQKLEADPMYQEQNETIKKLTSELEALREKIQTMEGELDKALKVIEQQNIKLLSIDEEQSALHAKFREDLEKANRAMRQEVERMREVMRQNYEEMRHLREQNLEMHGDVRAIKEMLRASGNPAPEGVNTQRIGTGLPRPLTASPSPAPSYARRLNGQASSLAHNGPGRMVGGNIAKGVSNQDSRRGNHVNFSDNRRTEMVSRAGSIPNSQVANSSRLGSNADNSTMNYSSRNQSRVLNGIHVDSSGYYSNVTTSRLSTDTSKPRLQPVSINSSAQIPGTQKAGNSTSGADGRSLPAICSVKEGVYPVSRQPSGRGKQVVRKGSAVGKK